MKKLLKDLSLLAQLGEKFVVATIFNKSGSAPRTVGAKMVVKTDGSILGTIGGGRLEAEAIRLASDAVVKGKSVIYSFLLTGKDVAEMDMICGGRGEVLLEFIDASDKSVQTVYQEAAELMEQRGKGWLVTKLEDADDGWYRVRRHCLVKQDGSLVGRFDGDADFMAKLVQGPARISIHADVIENQRFFVEPIRTPSTAFIFGAGHVSQQIAPLSEKVGFRTIVLDDRPDFANRSRFSEPVEIRLIESFEQFPEREIDEDSYIIIVTRGHLHDKTVLEQALRAKAGYIGMIGSRRKRNAIYEALATQGFEKRDLDRVHSPIGTNIGAETPEELAVSIVGELIKVRAEREQRASAKQ
ncbi:MAG TPA: XdhC family protein [Dissulfurispiraceae bacterium]|nr:XdhC family protein [Dissulfurispiraceae bacterium]